LVYGVILAGGKGERFWPLSRADRPKQFLKLTSGKMMLEETIDRVLPIIPYDNIRIITGESMRRFIVDSIERATDKNIISEPCGRNTCIAIGLAAVHLLKEDPTAIMVVLSADHLIKPAEKLLQILDAGASIASTEERLITIGIVPTRPETGYGYIKMGEMYKHEGEHIFYNISGFTEKPKAPLAHEYYYSHQFLWNSGMFIWSAKTILNAIKEFQPTMADHLEEYTFHIGTENELKARNELYEKTVNISIDVAVLEKANNVLTVRGDIIWDDIGGWNALPRYKKMNQDNNVIVGNVVTIDSYETIIFNEDEGLIACLGVSDLVIVKTGNITMVVHKTKADRIKEILARLEEDEDLHKFL